MSADPGNDEPSQTQQRRRRPEGEAHERASLLNYHNSYGRLFELGHRDELRHALAANVKEALRAPSRSIADILCVVDDVMCEREWGWHLALTPAQLRVLSSWEGKSSRLLCTDCTLPGCCYFEIVRLTADDLARLSSHLKLSREEFVTRYCTPHVDTNDCRYTHALKKAKPCEFLGEDGRCRVYADRPTVCAQFPFVFDPTTGEVTEIRLFPFCNVAFNAVKHEITRRILAGHVNCSSRPRRHRSS